MFKLDKKTQTHLNYKLQLHCKQESQRVPISKNRNAVSTLNKVTHSPLLFLAFWVIWMVHKMRSKLDFWSLRRSIVSLPWHHRQQTLSGRTPSTPHTHANTHPIQWWHLPTLTNFELQKKIPMLFFLELNEIYTIITIMEHKHLYQATLIWRFH